MPFQIDKTGVLPSDSGKVIEYRVTSLATGKPVDFDNFIHRGNPPVDIYQEYKGNYSWLQEWVKKSRVEEIIAGMVQQATRQRAALGDSEVLEWFFKDEYAADLARDAFDDAGLDIDVYVVK